MWVAINLKAIYFPTDSKMDKSILLHSHDGVLLHPKNEPTKTANVVDDSRNDYWVKEARYKSIYTV